MILLAAKILLDIIPGMRQDYSWSMLNIGYCIVRVSPRTASSQMLTRAAAQVSYMIFHYVTGVPFDATSNSGVYDRLTLWEQIDSGAQYTPAKKWLTTVPIAVFLAATHYTRFDAHPALFTLNLISLALIGLAPKLPYFHRIRIRFFDSGITPGAFQPSFVQQKLLADPHGGWVHRSVWAADADRLLDAHLPLAIHLWACARMRRALDTTLYSVDA